MVPNIWVNFVQVVHVVVRNVMHVLTTMLTEHLESKIINLLLDGDAHLLVLIVLSEYFLGL